MARRHMGYIAGMGRQTNDWVELCCAHHMPVHAFGSNSYTHLFMLWCFFLLTNVSFLFLVDILAMCVSAPLLRMSHLFSAYFRYFSTHAQIVMALETKVLN